MEQTWAEGTVTFLSRLRQRYCLMAATKRSLVRKMGPLFSSRIFSSCSASTCRPRLLNKARPAELLQGPQTLVQIRRCTLHSHHTGCACTAMRELLPQPACRPGSLQARLQMQTHLATQGRGVQASCRVSAAHRQPAQRTEGQERIPLQQHAHTGALVLQQRHLLSVRLAFGSHST